MVKPFKAAWWLPGPHLQTIWPPLFRREQKNLRLKRERIELPDNDFIDLDWVASAEKNSPIVLIMHGLEGSVHSPYARGMLEAMTKQGWRSAVVHFRSCSGELNRLPRTYHCGDTSDIAGVVDFIHEREPNTPIVAVGFSMGGNILLKWLGETGKQNPLTAAVAISVPYSLEKTIEKLQHGFSRFYHWHLLRCLQHKVTQKFCTQPSPIPLPPIANLRTMREFDDKITAPLHGFIDAEDYYTVSSCRQFLKDITVPTLLLQAKDDPFMPSDVIPELHELPASVQLEVSARGGHVGFVSGRFPWRPEYWLEQRVPSFLAQHFVSQKTVTTQFTEVPA